MSAATLSDAQLVQLCKANEQNPGIVRGILREHARRKAKGEPIGFDDRKLWAGFEHIMAEFERLMNRGARHG